MPNTALGNAGVAVNVSQFHADGYAIVDGVFSPSRIDWLRAQILRRRQLGLLSGSGSAIADFMKKDQQERERQLARAAPGKAEKARNSLKREKKKTR